VTFVMYNNIPKCATRSRIQSTDRSIKEKCYKRDSNEENKYSLINVLIDFEYVVGSSRRTILGLPINAIATESRRCNKIKKTLSNWKQVEKWIHKNSKKEWMIMSYWKRECDSVACVCVCVCDCDQTKNVKCTFIPPLYCFANLLRARNKFTWPNQ
jgi:hypothetical protein